MLDIDYVLSARPIMPRHLIHVYEEGAFSREVMATVRSLCDQNGWLPHAPDYTDLAGSLRGASLLGTLLVSISLDALAALPDLEHAASILAEAAERTSNRFFLHGRAKAFQGTSAWGALCAGATMLTEPDAMTPALAPKILSMLAMRDASLRKVSNRALMESTIKTWAGLNDFTLSSFLGQLDVALAISIDGDTFDPSAFRDYVAASKPHEYYRWHDSLARFLSFPVTTRLNFLVEIDEALHREGLDPGQVFGGMLRATFDLFIVNEPANPGEGTRPDTWSEFRWRRLRSHKTVPALTLLRWNVLLAHAEPQLRAGSTLAWFDLLNSLAAPAKPSP